MKKELKNHEEKYIHINKKVFFIMFSPLIYCFLTSLYIFLAFIACVGWFFMCLVYFVIMPITSLFDKKDRKYLEDYLNIKIITKEIWELFE